jgi:hypothetical protein
VILALAAGVLGAAMAAVGAVMLAMVTAGPGWVTPLELVGGFLLIIAGGTGMTWAVGR